MKSLKIVVLSFAAAAVAAAAVRLAAEVFSLPAKKYYTVG